MIVLALMVALILVDYGAVTYYGKETYFYFMVFYILVEKLKESQKELNEYGGEL